MGLNILRAISLFLIIATAVPFLKWDYWWIRIFDYPRVQKLLLIVAALIVWASWGIYKPGTEQWGWIAVLATCAVFLTVKIWPYTPFSKKMISSVNYTEDSGIYILVSNVYQENRAYSKAVNLVKELRPDLVFLVETDQAWIDGVSEIESSYPYCIKIGKDNTYGMALYSKLELVREEINYLIDPEIPSLDIDLKLRNGKTITIYGIHPTPPVPGENLKSTERDAEILLVGKKSKQNKQPSMVIGDLNDVAWSYTTELFLKTSGMADPRRGRGFFSTFHAKVPLFRWPLDHIFLSKHFGLAELKVNRTIGSDHFPISIKAILTSNSGETTETLSADSEEKKEAREKIDRGLNEED